MTQLVRYRTDPETGSERYCPRCDEWWPFDEEFWVSIATGAHCRACKRRADRLYAAERRAIWRAMVRRPHPCARCLTVLTQNRECHGCAGRVAGPLTVQFLASHGLAGAV